MRARDKRIGKVQEAVDAAPICRHTLREEYEWFCKTGELPDDDHLTYEIVMQALRGGKEKLPEIRPYHQRKRPREHYPPSVRGYLFDEALKDQPQLRQLARLTISHEVSIGGDVESEGFGARHGIPTYGAQALHCWNPMVKLGNPPYEEQARRLFVRRDNICARIAEQGQGWFTPYTLAFSQFCRDGSRPEDSLILETVLMSTEEWLLVRHWRGHDVAEPMALLDRIARTKDDDERDKLIDELCAMSAAGELP